MKRKNTEHQVTKRSQARMLALQALCAFEGVGEQFDPQLEGFLRDYEALIDLGIPVPPDEDLIRFARTLAREAWTQRKSLDAMLERTSTHWRLDRMPPVDRNVLRLGLYEMLEAPETPPQIVINEAIELARLFGDADSTGFVNGVLDALRKTVVDLEEPDDAGDASAEVETEGDHGLV